MGCLPLLLLGLGILAASALAWFSLQSLLQARALYRLARSASGEPDGFGRQALHGRVRVTRALQKGFGELLWCRTQNQVYTRRRKNSGWSTVGTRDELAAFVLDVQGQDLTLSEEPTEVQETRRRVENHERTGFMGWGQGDGDRRTIYTYLDVPSSATVVGRRTGPATLGRDNKLGLLLSPHEPAKAAGIELGKGIAGLALVTVAVIVGLLIYYR